MPEAVAQIATPGRCQGCHAEILFVQMAPKPDDSPGGKMPVDIPWLYGDDQRTLVVLDDDGFGHVIVKAGEDVLGREPHWGRCPAREQFKRKPKKVDQQSLF